MIRNKYKKQSGYADTKKYPHKDHPARYRRNGKDLIEYITFTHHPVVKIGERMYTTIPLSDNIDPIIQRKNKHNKIKEISYVYPKKFIGKRSALGKERTDLCLAKNDLKTVECLFDTLPKEYVRYSNKNRRKK